MFRNIQQKEDMTNVSIEVCLDLLNIINIIDCI